MPRLSRMIFVRNRYLCILALSLAMAGCAVDPVPNEQLRLSEQAVAQARAVVEAEAYVRALRRQYTVTVAEDRL